MTLNEETLHFITQHRNDDVRNLALRAHQYPQVSMTDAITQIAGWQAARDKLPTWAATPGILYPPHLSMEQSSSEITARYKAQLIAKQSAPHHTLTDLTGGLGIDCSFLATQFTAVHYVERQEVLCNNAQHNFPLLHLSHIQVHHTDSITYLHTMTASDWIFIDPARRDSHGGKTVSIADCEPNVAILEEDLLSKAPCLLIKLSPMLDLTLAINTLQHVTQAHIVSAGNECKELLLIAERNTSIAPDEVPIHCINLLTDGSMQEFTFTRQQEAESLCSYADEPAVWLYEPNASLLKAGAFRSLAAAWGLRKLHPNSHLYTSQQLIPKFPGRTFHIESWCGFGKKELKQALNGLTQANLTIRNFPATVAELRKRLKINEGGHTYLFATTLSNQHKVLLICHKPTGNL